ncbi:MAG: hypothetical protein IPJ37_09040 [Bacteroidales bacterium]|nr:hypothetical protein [Bacteroidales bacterium]
MWLQEGFATYSELVFAERIKGYDTSLIYANYWLAATVKNKFPVVGPANVSYWDYRDGMFTARSSYSPYNQEYFK